MKDRYYFLIVALIFLLIILNNTIPSGYVFAAGDFNQFFNLQNNYMKLFYTWTDYSSDFGAYSPLFSNFFLYLILTPIDMIFKSPPLLMQINWFIVLFGSFLSFYYSLKILKINSNKTYQILISLIYPLNFFVLNIFMNPYFNRLQSSLYICFPILFSLSYCILNDKKINLKLISCYGIILFVFLFAFPNSAYIVLLSILIGIIFLFCLFYKKINWINFLLLIAINFLILSIIIFPTIPNSLNGINTIAESNVNGVSLKGWFIWQSTSYTNIYGLPVDPSPTQFLEKFPYPDYLKFIFILGSFVYIILFLFSIIKNKEDHKKNILLICIISILFLFLLGGKLTPPFSDLKYSINTFPLLLLFRSTEKILLLIPFFTILGIAILFDNIKKEKTKLILFIILILIPTPLYIGNVFTDFNIYQNRGQDYLTSNYSVIVKIPTEYYNLANQINNDSENFRILGLPYSIVNSENWMNYIKWKHVGSDPTQEIISKPLLNPDEKIEDWFPLKDFNNKTLCDEWLIYYSSISNVKYLVYHKDVQANFINLTRLDYLTNQGYIKKIQSNDYFDLYYINNSYFKPLIYSNINVVDVHDENFSNEDIPDLFCSDRQFNNLYENNNLSSSNLQTNDLNIEYNKINPTKYEVTIKNIKGNFPIIFSETYSSLWHLSSDKSINSNHFKADGYLNGWIIDPKGNSELKLTLDYYPQTLFYIGLFISLATLICCIIYLFYGWRKSKIIFKNK